MLPVDSDLKQFRNGIPITQRGIVWKAIVENRIRGVMDKPQPDYYKVRHTEITIKKGVDDFEKVIFTKNLPKDK